MIDPVRITDLKQNFANCVTDLPTHLSLFKKALKNTGQFSTAEAQELTIALMQTLLSVPSRLETNPGGE